MWQQPLWVSRQISKMLKSIAKSHVKILRHRMTLMLDVKVSFVVLTLHHREEQLMMDQVNKLNNNKHLLKIKFLSSITIILRTPGNSINITDKEKIKLNLINLKHKMWHNIRLGWDLLQPNFITQVQCLWVKFIMLKQILKILSRLD